MAVEDTVAFPSLIAGGLKDLLGDGDRADTGEPNNADAALLRHDSSGDRSDGFGLVYGLSRIGFRRSRECAQDKVSEILVKLREFAATSVESCYRIVI